MKRQQTIRELEAAAQDAHEAGWSIDRFRQRFWREIFRACNGRGKPDLGTFVERLKTILATGKAPEPAGDTDVNLPAAVVGQSAETFHVALDVARQRIAESYQSGVVAAQQARERQAIELRRQAAQAAPPTPRRRWTAWRGAATR